MIKGFAAAFVLYQGKKIFPVETESIFYGKRKEYNYILLSKLRLRIFKMDGTMSGMQTVEYICGRDGGYRRPYGGSS